MTTAHSKSDLHPLDALTGGAFSAPTSGERAARIREWLVTSPSAEQMHDVFKDLSGRDKGAAKLLREKLDEIKRLKNQEGIGPLKLNIYWMPPSSILQTPWPGNEMPPKQARHFPVNPWQV